MTVSIAIALYNGEKFIDKIADELACFEEKVIARGNNNTLTELENASWKIVADEYPKSRPSIKSIPLTAPQTSLILPTPPPRPAEIFFAVSSSIPNRSAKAQNTDCEQLKPSRK